MKTTLVVGDIHGCLSTLKALIAKAGPVDEIISVGDLIDRGPDSLAVVKYCIENNIKVCLGNHEHMAISAIKKYLGPNYTYKRMDLHESDWFLNGGDKVFLSCTDEDLQLMLDYFNTLPIYIKTDYTANDLPVVISHTCLNNYAYDILNVTQEDLKARAASFVWSRSQSIDLGKFFNIYGHTPTDYLGIKGAVPRQSKTGINLDTGCAYTTKDRGKLTAVILPSLQIIQQERL
jgi:serine/threonine protein phosphatase 1